VLREPVEHGLRPALAVGLLQLDCDVLRVDGADLRVVLFTAALGTPQADALSLLASLDVTPVQ
jgi:hypothetical protein